MEQQFQVSEGAGPATAVVKGRTAIDRGAELHVRVLEAAEPVALAELASASGIPKSTAARLLSALERQGLVEEDGERGRLRPGPAILRVVERNLLERNIVELAAPSLDTLGEISGETINLGVPTRHGVEHIAQVESRHFLGAGRLGRSVNHHCTAIGKVFMAFGRAPIAATPLARLSADTVTSLSELRAELKTVRAESFAAAIDELELGHEEVLQMLYGETPVGNAAAVKDGVNDGLADGMDPERILYDALIPSLEEVGARFERGDYLVPEMLSAARATQGALDILRPLLADTDTPQVGTFLLGTVKGDVHDIGKNLCNIIDTGLEQELERLLADECDKSAE